jgi:Flp pilus assembly protein protease CpaA
LIVTLMAATLSDVVSHRIPNALLAPALLTAIVLSFIISGTQGILMSIGGLGVGLALLLPLYALGAMGAGDVKLLGVAGAYLGPVGAVYAGLLTYVAGALIGILYIGWHKLKSHRAGSTPDNNARISGLSMPLLRLSVWISSFAKTKHVLGTVESREISRKNSTFAYAPAILIGTVAALWAQQWPMFLSIG